RARHLSKPTPSTSSAMLEITPSAYLWLEWLYNTARSPLYSKERLWGCSAYGYWVSRPGMYATRHYRMQLRWVRSGSRHFLLMLCRLDCYGLTGVVMPICGRHGSALEMTYSAIWRC